MQKTKKGQTRRVVGLLLIIALVYTYLLPWGLSLQFGNTETTLSIAFEGSGSGLDPQGNRFDINEIKNEEILNTALEKAGLSEKMSAEDLANRLYVLPQAGQDTLKQLLTLSTINGKTQDIKEQIIYPTNFVIGLRDIGLPSVLSDRKLLKEITKAYKVYLKSRYLADTGSEPAFTKEEILAMDYPEMMKVLTQQTETIERYIAVYAENEPQFVSKETDLTFSDLSEKVSVLKETDIGSMQSLVRYYRLTKDPNGRVQYEQTLLKRAQLIAAKLQGAQVTTNEILAIYDNNSNYLFAGSDSGNVNLAPVENQFYSDLMQALVDKKTAYIDAKYNQMDISRAIEKMQAGMLAGEQYTSVTDTIKKGTESVLTQMEELQTLARTMAEEYYDSNIGSKISFAGVSYSLSGNGSLLVNFAVLLAVVFLAKLIIQHLYDSEYGVYVTRICRAIQRRSKRSPSDEQNVS